MNKPKKTVKDVLQRKQVPAMSPEQREQQMINYAVNLAEKQLRDGTASSQVITHYLKLGTMKERYELEKLKSDVKLNEAKIKHIDLSEKQQEKYDKAIEAMMRYRIPYEN